MVQVHDCNAETARTVATDARLVREPATLGAVARLSMITDPRSDELVISQRASLTGPLPDGPPPTDRI